MQSRFSLFFGELPPLLFPKSVQIIHPLTQFAAQRARTPKFFVDHQPGDLLPGAAAFAAVAIYAAYERGQRKMAERELRELREKMSVLEAK